MSLTRFVETVLKAPIKRPNGLRCAGTAFVPSAVDPTEPVVGAVYIWAVR
jgi:hypothetical protein